MSGEAADAHARDVILVRERFDPLVLRREVIDHRAEVETATPAALVAAEGDELTPLGRRNRDLRPIALPRNAGREVASPAEAREMLGFN